MTSLPLETVYAFHKREQEVVLSMMKNGSTFIIEEFL